MTRLGAGAALLLLAATGCDGSGTGCAVDLERMQEQPRYTAYGRSRHFEDGRAMREPPEGTVPWQSAATPEAPVRLDRALLEAGRERYGIFCAPCHGRDGRADTPVAAAMDLRPPPSLHAPRIRRRGLDHVTRVAEEGYGLMPGYGKLLSERELRAVTHWVGVLRLSASVRLQRLPPDLRRRARAALGAEEGSP